MSTVCATAWFAQLGFCSRNFAQRGIRPAGSRAQGFRMRKAGLIAPMGLPWPRPPLASGGCWQAAYCHRWGLDGQPND